MSLKFNTILMTAIAAIGFSCPSNGEGTSPLKENTIVRTGAYEWTQDAVVQGPYRAWAEDDFHIVSTYSAQPHFYMPIDKEWRLRNDISSYPKLISSNTLQNAVYNMAIDEMVNAVEPDTTLRTGKEWAGVWTRDVSYSIILSMSYMQPLASEMSLRKKVNANGRIIQDTGSGGAWPVSSDRMIWTVAAYELYKATGERSWLEFAYPVAKASMDDDILVTHTPDKTVKGETSFIDWREQSYPRWMQTADIYQSEALGTTAIHAIALDALSKMATDLGKEEEATKYAAYAEELREGLNKKFWMEDKGYYAMYSYGRNSMILNPRAETLGESLCILYDLAPEQRQRRITECNPTTAFGAAIFYPQISDMPSYHNNALWPWVGSMWALANAKVGNEEGTLEAIGAVVRPAALFCTNKENFNLDNGDIATELNSSNMLWCLAGNIALTHRILFGINFEEGRLAFHPFVPKALAAERRLEGFKYRDAVLNISISGHGSRIASFKMDGKECEPAVMAGTKGIHEVEILMEGNEPEAMKVNHVANCKAPLTPISRMEEGEFRWNPIEYIHHYIVIRDGKRIATTRRTSWDASVCGEYQVIGVASDGTESFASEPVYAGRSLSFEFSGETTEAHSEEISYLPDSPIEGWHGAGFVETDHVSGPVSIKVKVRESGIYALSIVYANGNGPVNTENKCAVRTLCVDGEREGIIVLPHRGVGNWNDWGKSNTVFVRLSKGTHTVELTLRPENENMNLHTNHALLDRLVLQKTGK